MKNLRVTVQSEQLGLGVSKFTTSGQDCIQKFYVNFMSFVQYIDTIM